MLAACVGTRASQFVAQSSSVAISWLVIQTTALSISSIRNDRLYIETKQTMKMKMMTCERKERKDNERGDKNVKPRCSSC
mmetsp:Transcript_9388/g.12916  ORF Transcript_9388/g.12916 Transcript_9388/m.12916 type:complete len:80 (-) Transcript_9388:78-317(-)